MLIKIEKELNAKLDNDAWRTNRNEMRHKTRIEGVEQSALERLKERDGEREIQKKIAKSTKLERVLNAYRG